MRFALLYYSSLENAADALPPPERDAWFADMRAWREELERAGIFRTGMRLVGTEAATSLRSQGGSVRVMDGPFAETKEMLGGLTVIECQSREEALGWARRCPIVRIGTVEVRAEFGAPGNK